MKRTLISIATFHFKSEDFSISILIKIQLSEDKIENRFRFNWKVQAIRVDVGSKQFFFKNDKFVFFVFNNKIKLLDRDMMCRLPDLIPSLVFFSISLGFCQSSPPNGIMAYVISRLLWSYSIVTLQKNSIWWKNPVTVVILVNVITLSLSQSNHIRRFQLCFIIAYWTLLWLQKWNHYQF